MRRSTVPAKTAIKVPFFSSGTGSATADVLGDAVGELFPEPEVVTGVAGVSTGAVPGFFSLFSKISTTLPCSSSLRVLLLICCGCQEISYFL